jgi:hypothetical protein
MPYGLLQSGKILLYGRVDPGLRFWTHSWVKPRPNWDGVGFAHKSPVAQ